MDTIMCSLECQKKKRETERDYMKCINGQNADDTIL
jgi:hypothetical protein